MHREYQACMEKCIGSQGRERGGRGAGGRQGGCEWVGQADVHRAQHRIASADQHPTRMGTKQSLFFLLFFSFLGDDDDDEIVPRT